MDIEQRFAHLERSNRHLRIGLVILTIAITFGIVGQVTPGDVIKAKEFQVVNNDGQVLVRMSGGMWGAINVPSRAIADYPMHKGYVQTFRHTGRVTGKLGN
jgi:hypothetical protein